MCCSPGSSLCSVLYHRFHSPAWQCLSLWLSVLGSFHRIASRAFGLGQSPFRKEFIYCSMMYTLELCLFLFISIETDRAACNYLQPVIETVWAFLCVQTFNVEVVREVKRDYEARFYRNYILTGQSMRRGVRVAWTEQMSLELIKYAPLTGYWTRRKEKHLVTQHHVI